MDFTLPDHLRRLLAEMDDFTVPFYWWTFNMPRDHGEVELKDVRVSADAVLGEVDRGRR